MEAKCEQIHNHVDEGECKHECGIRDSRSGRACDSITGKRATTSSYDGTRGGVVCQRDFVIMHGMGYIKTCQFCNVVEDSQVGLVRI